MITGITGQDGAYLAEFLLGKGYEDGIKRRASSFNTARVDHLYQDLHEEHVRFFMHYGDLTDATNLIRVIQNVQPDEIYNLAAQSHVQASFETPEYTANSDALGTLRLLEAIRILGLEQKTRFYQASTSEMFGKVQEIPQGEKMRPEEIKIEIDRLALSEKLLLVEDVWDSIAISNFELPLPEWQKKELDRRYHEYKRGKLDLYNWETTHTKGVAMIPVTN